MSDKYDNNKCETENNLPKITKTEIKRKKKV